jgi:hypothetical protein
VRIAEEESCPTATPLSGLLLVRYRLRRGQRHKQILDRKPVRLAFAHHQATNVNIGRLGVHIGQVGSGVGRHVRLSLTLVWRQVVST